MSPQPLIESVPNFSEGRRPDVVDKIVHSIRNGGAVHILDQSSDADHNRSVVTVAGPPDELVRALFAGIRTAAELINLDDHEGEHPRFGATDVVPFIPIRDVTMQDCVELAQRLGKQVGEELGIPVFLYEEAATRPDRHSLSKIRKSKFQYEQLKDAIEVNPDYMPDFGPASVGPAGATIIGARAPLIAYNVYLTTDDVSIAQKIARAVRHSSGGLAYVKALGLSVEGKAQVSMNLTDYRHTPIHRVVEMIRREAQRYGVAVLESELIGLTPQQALIDSAQWYLQLDRFESDQILEERIQQSENNQSTLGSEEPPVPTGATRHVELPDFDEESRPAAFAAAVADITPTPGGGAVAALVGALAAALTEMVSGITVNKTKNKDKLPPQMTAVVNAAHDLRQKLLDGVVKDVVAFDEVMAAYRLTRTDEEGQDQLIQEKLLAAADVPLHVCRYALEALQLADQIVDTGRKSATTDLAVGAHMALAALESAGLNVRINLLDITDRDMAGHMLDEFTQLHAEAIDLHASIIDRAERRAGLRA